MEKLLEMAKQVCDKAEIYSIEYSDNAVSFQDAKLHEIESSYQSGISLRIIKDGKEGFAYTRNLIDRQELLDNARLSLEGGVEAGYDFPLTTEIPRIDSYDSSLENLTNAEIVDEGNRVCDLLKSKTDTEIMLSGIKHLTKARLINTAGTDLSARNSIYGIFGVAVTPGSGSGIHRFFQSTKYEKMPDSYINEIAELFNHTKKEASFGGGKMKVLFMPNSQIVFKYRLLTGMSAKSLYEETSPIADKIDRQIFSSNLTIYDDPLDEAHPGAGAFDDEGVASKPLTLVENGVFKNYYYDLKYAAKLNAQSTGHGHKTSMWGGDAITLKPTPALKHLRIKPGDKNLTELIRLIDRGIIVEGSLGPHSGNIPNGDYSVGAVPGLYVENGEIVGLAKDIMAAGNIYETLNNVIGVGDKQYAAYGTWVPPILCDGVSVATKI